MNWEIVGATGEWAGAAVVVATLFYLAKQVALSNKLAIAQADQVFLESWQGAVTELGSDLTTGSIIQRGIQDYSSLTQPEKVVFHTRMAAVFNKAEIGVRLHAQGLLTQDLLNVCLDVCAGVLQGSGCDEWWQEVGFSFFVYEKLEQWRKQKDRTFPNIHEFSMYQSDQVGGLVE